MRVISIIVDGFVVMEVPPVMLGIRSLVTYCYVQGLEVCVKGLNLLLFLVVILYLLVLDLVLGIVHVEYLILDDQPGG